MKIAVYGVSRSGKDYFIKDLVNEFKKNQINAVHLNGSKILNNLSILKLCKKFNSLSEIEKEQIRKEFINYVNLAEKKYDVTIVDGHYSFFNSDMISIDKVCTELDLNCYDYFFYLDTDASEIISRMKLSFGDKFNDRYSADDIEKWKNYEINHMSEDLLSLDKELHVIKYTDEKIIENDNEINLTLSYVLAVINGKYDSKIFAQALMKNINIGDCNSVILVDCDKTLSYEDTTEELLKLKNLNDKQLKEIYKNDRYTNFQALEAINYYNDNKLFENINYERIIKSINFNESLINDLKTKSNSKIIAITAGNSGIWSHLLKKTGLSIIVINTNMIMSKYIKYFVMKDLQERGKYVVAIGDSMMDSLMLRYANKSYIVSNKGFRENINELLCDNPQIHQLSYSNFFYKNCPIDTSIDSIRCLDEKNEKIAQFISICKSDSGILGKELRLAHYYLGQEIAKLIRNDYKNDDFVVIILMRSGLCFGQGIVDYFDCSELFYDENNSSKFETEFFNNPIYVNKRIIIVDGVINSGKTMKEIISKMHKYKTIIATNVISSKFNVDYIHPIYATRISNKSFIGAKQKEISNGKGPDTSDRLFRNI